MSENKISNLFFAKFIFTYLCDADEFVRSLSRDHGHDHWDPQNDCDLRCFLFDFNKFHPRGRLIHPHNEYPFFYHYNEVFAWLRFGFFLHA